SPGASETGPPPRTPGTPAPEAQPSHPRSAPLPARAAASTPRSTPPPPRRAVPSGSTPARSAAPSSSPPTPPAPARPAPRPSGPRGLTVIPTHESSRPPPSTTPTPCTLPAEAPTPQHPHSSDTDHANANNAGCVYAVSSRGDVFPSFGYSTDKSGRSSSPRRISLHRSSAPRNVGCVS